MWGMTPTSDEMLSQDQTRSDHCIEVLIHTTLYPGTMNRIIGAFKEILPKAGVSVARTDMGIHIWIGTPDVPALPKEQAEDEDPRDEWTYVRDGAL